MTVTILAMRQEGVTTHIRQDQLEKIEALLEARKQRDPVATRADVIRDLLDLGLHRYKRDHR